MDNDFDAFYELTAPAAHRLALALTGNSHDARDLVQSCYERVFRKWRRNSIKNPSAFMRSVVVNTWASEVRKARWTRESAAETLPDRSTGEEHFAQRAAEASMLLTALGKLPLRQREAVVLRHLEDLSVAATAELMRCSDGTVKRLCFDGLRNLQDDLRAPATALGGESDEFAS